MMIIIRTMMMMMMMMMTRITLVSLLSFNLLIVATPTIANATMVSKDTVALAMVGVATITKLKESNEASVIRVIIIIITILIITIQSTVILVEIRNSTVDQEIRIALTVG